MTCVTLTDYTKEGFLALQYALDQVIVNMKLGALSDMPLVDIHMKRFPYPHYNDDNFVLVLQQQLPFILMLSFVFSALQIVKDVVYEKERKLKVNTLA